jgi:hypothetical protein
MSHPEGRILGYVELKVASRIYKLPVQAAPLTDGVEGPTPKAGFFYAGTEDFGILVDANAPDVEQRATIERASVEAERVISRKLLN